jgi:hypothetical protein
MKPYIIFYDNAGLDKDVDVYFDSEKSANSFITDFEYIGGCLRFNYDYIDDLQFPPPQCIKGHNSIKFFKHLYKLLYGQELK